MAAIGQDETSSVVYGMNKAAFVDGVVRARFTLDELAGVLQDIAAFREGLEETGGPS
jgi:two-component system chemotaxis response regulator CheB